jgi:hypothetical protein
VDLGAHPPTWRIILLYFVRAFLEGEFPLDLLHADLVLMPIFCCTLSQDFDVTSLLILGEEELSLRGFCPHDVT